MTTLSCQEHRSRSQPSLVLLPRAGAINTIRNSAIPRMIELPIFCEGLLVIQKQLHNVREPSLRRHVQAGRPSMRHLVRHLSLAQLSYDMVVAVEGCIVQSIEALVVTNIPPGQFVLDDDLHDNLVPETAGQHQRRDAIAGHREVHVDVVIDGSQVEQILKVIGVDGSQHFLLLRGEVIVDVRLLLEGIEICLRRLFFWYQGTFAHLWKCIKYKN